MDQELNQSSDYDGLNTLSKDREEQIRWSLLGKILMESRNCRKFLSLDERMTAERFALAAFALHPRKDEYCR